MSKKYDGGPAFPDPGRAQSEKQREKLTETGMSLRDYFAAKAIQGMCADPNFNPSSEKAAKLAYAVADAMLAAREAA